VLDNALNNDTTLAELGKAMGFKPIQKRLRCIGYILNLIAESYIFGQDSSTFEENYKTFKENYKKVLPGERRQL
jgi:hypothetical protein